MPDHLAVLRERRDWLRARIEAKQTMEMGWDTVRDVRELEALDWALLVLTANGEEARG